MLSRVADSLYWMSRYLERAEHTARLIDVHLTLLLDQSPGDAGKGWARLFASLGLAPGEASARDPGAMVHTLAFAPENPDALLQCIASARFNARQVREHLSSEVWEYLNRLYLTAREMAPAEAFRQDPHALFRVVQEGAYLVQGVADATMSHGEGWHFIQAGRHIERLAAVAAQVDEYFQEYEHSRPAPGREPADYNEYLSWVTLLRACGSFEAYCRVYTAEIRPERIAEFLLWNPELPRSVRFAARRIHDDLGAIAASTASARAARIERLTGRLRSELEYADVADVLRTGVHDYVARIQALCGEIHGAMYQAYVEYPA